MRVKLFVLIFFAFFSCQPNQIDLGSELDLALFKSDRGACDGKRTNQISILETLTETMLGHSENEIIATLGRYDFQMLNSRNQKVFIYFLERGPHCETPRKPTEAKTMAIYFNATKLVKEVTFQEGIL